MERMSISGGVAANLINFSGERSSWRGWSKIHRAQTRVMGCDEAFNEQPGQALRVGADDFDRSKIPAERLQKAEQAWRSLVTTCQGVALDLVVEAQSPGEAWAALTAYYDTGTQGKRRRLRQELHDTTMKPRENPAEFTQRVDQIVHELRHLGANVDEEEVTSVILKGLTDEYQDAKKLLLDAEEELTRTNIERVLQQRFESTGRDQGPFRGTRVMVVKAAAKCSEEHTAAEHEKHLERNGGTRIHKHTEGRTRRRRRAFATCECDWSHSIQV